MRPRALSSRQSCSQCWPKGLSLLGYKNAFQGLYPTHSSASTGKPSLVSPFGKPSLPATLTSHPNSDWPGPLARR